MYFDFVNKNGGGAATVGNEITTFYNPENKFPQEIYPKINQYNSHMVLTTPAGGGAAELGIGRRLKYISLDTKFRKSVSATKAENYFMKLPDMIKGISSITAVSAEIPFSYNNISSSMMNNTIIFNFDVGLNSETSKTLILPDGIYSSADLFSMMTTQISSLGISNSITIENTTGVSSLSSNNFFTTISFLSGSSFHNLTINFSVSHLGAMCGFRYPQYTLATKNSHINSEGFIDLTSPRYLFLVLDEFAGIGSPSYSFNALLPNSLVNKNILARIAIGGTYPVGTIIYANAGNGFLVSDKRTFFKQVDIDRFQISLVNEYGDYIYLNELNFSICLELGG